MQLLFFSQKILSDLTGKYNKQFFIACYIAFDILPNRKFIKLVETVKGVQ